MNGLQSCWYNLWAAGKEQQERNNKYSKNGNALWSVSRSFYRQCKLKHRQHLLIVELDEQI